MELVKHNKDLANRLELLDGKADLQLAKELMELHQKKCKDCQYDRLGCISRPKCKNRNFLNVLIEIGIDPQDLPEFCYSQYLELLRRYIVDGKGRGMENRRLLIKDLLSTLEVSSIRHFNTKFKKIWKSHASVTKNDLMLVAGESMIFHFDFARGVVNVNPLNLSVDSFEVLTLYAQLLSEYHNIETVVKDIALNWWELSIEVKDDASTTDFSSIKAKLADDIENFKFDKSSDQNWLRIEIVVDGVRPFLEVGSLMELFNLIASSKE
ncbi:MAG: hypothetical protein ACTSUO_05235 [Candidatus Thorarchaeota archaeon]